MEFYKSRHLIFSRREFDGIHLPPLMVRLAAEIHLIVHLIVTFHPDNRSRVILRTAPCYEQFRALSA
jgi:hypothetical protein